MEVLDNPLFSAGFGLLGVGSGLAILRNLSGRLSFLIKQRCFVTCEVSSRDPSYHSLLRWLTAKTMDQARHISVQSLATRNSSGGGNSNSSSNFAFIPSPGIHYLKWSGTWFKVERTRESGGAAAITSGVPFESVVLTTIGTKKDVYVRMLQEARQFSYAMEKGKTVIYTSWGSEWRPFGQPKRKRPLESVVLDAGVAESILQDVRSFLASEKWYLDRGIPYRRGYLLYGHPGTGKSSFIQALAGALDYNICIINLVESVLTDDRLNHLLCNTPDRTILLLEDVDAAFQSRQGQGQRQGRGGSVTFSGLLNALDGVAAAEERIIFMTTNHIELLDPALIRPGRVDVRQSIGLASDHQIKRLFSLFYRDHAGVSDCLASQFVRCLEQQKQGRLSMAEIQAHLVLHKNDPFAAIQSIQSQKEVIPNKLQS